MESFNKVTVGAYNKETVTKTDAFEEDIELQIATLTNVPISDNSNLILDQDKDSENENMFEETEETDKENIRQRKIKKKFGVVIFVSIVKLRF